MKINLLQNRISRWGLSLIQGYSHEKYWKRRERVVSGKGFFLWRAYYLLWIKRVDAKHLSSFGTNWGKGASFASPPLLPHGPNGIIVGHDVSIGRNVTICQQVTIMHGGGVILAIMFSLGRVRKFFRAFISEIMQKSAQTVLWWRTFPTEQLVFCKSREF